MTKYYPCKVGTIPELVQLRYNYKIEVGKSIKYRARNEKKWKNGVITKVHDDGRFMIEKGM